MKIKKLLFLSVSVFSALPGMLLGQAPQLGATADFVLFSKDGAIGNTGISHVTGNVGTNNGAITAFGNVDGIMDNADTATSKGAIDIVVLYDQLDTATATYFPSSTLGNGDTLINGVYEVSGATTLNGKLFIDAKGDANAVFIIKTGGAFSSSAGSEMVLINGALACNVFWKVEGLVSLGAGSKIKGTILANNAAISMGSGVQLEGRALSTAGAVTIDNVLAYLPIGCGSKSLKGPIAPTLNSVACYALFSSDGAVTNTGITNVKGDVGTNVGLTTGFDTLLVTGKVHAAPDASTAQCSTDLLNVYAYIDTLPYDIELLFPAQLGNNLVLTPHTYLMNAAAVFTDTLVLNAQGDSAAVFVIKINGALTTGTYSNVKLINGAKSKNVYWKVEGAVTINNYSVFRGTLISNNGALGAINTGVELDGRALTTAGALNTAAINVTIPSPCGGGSTATAPVIITEPSNQIACNGLPVNFTVVATGTNLQYQWRRGNVDLTNGVNISGAKTNALQMSNVVAGDTALDYNVVVSGDASPNDTSINVSLKLCKGTGVKSYVTGNTNAVAVYPNPFTTSIEIKTSDISLINNSELRIYNIMGKLVLQTNIVQMESTIEAAFLPSGIYFYKVTGNNKVINTGKLVK